MYFNVIMLFVTRVYYNLMYIYMFIPICVTFLTLISGCHNSDPFLSPYPRFAYEHGLSFERINDIIKEQKDLLQNLIYTGTVVIIILYIYTYTIVCISLLFIYTCIITILIFLYFYIYNSYIYSFV